MTDALLAEVLELRSAKVPVALVTSLPEGSQRLVRPDALDPLAEAAARALRTDRAATVDHDGCTWFVRPYNPPLRLLILGAVHIAQPLCTMGILAGYEVVVVDPRTAFATPERFGNVPLITEWPDQALERLGIDTRTAVVALTHDPKLDDPALVRALTSPAFYVGALGSRRTNATRLERLGTQGLTPAQLGRLSGPIGLDIGARSPAEIAVAILAEITQTLRAVP